VGAISVLFLESPQGMRACSFFFLSFTSAGFFVIRTKQLNCTLEIVATLRGPPPFFDIFSKPRSEQCPLFRISPFSMFLHSEPAPDVSPSAGQLRLRPRAVSDLGFSRSD